MRRAIRSGWLRACCSAWRLVEPLVVDGHVLVGVLHLDAVAVEHALPFNRPWTTTGMHSWKMPPGSPLVADRDRRRR